MSWTIRAVYATALCRVDSATLPLQPWEEHCTHWTANQMTMVRTVHENAKCYPRCLLGETWHTGRVRCVQCALTHYEDWNGTARHARPAQTPARLQAAPTR